MRFMRFMHLLLAGVAALAFSAAASAQSQGYTTLDAPQRTDAGQKVEVLEFFMYFCPHCNALEPKMAEWVKKQGDNISFRRVHLLAGGPNDPQAHAFVTLEAMGKLEEMHSKIFRAIHVERNRLSSDDAILDFLVKNGIDKAKYLEFFNSFAVQTKLKRNGQMAAAYKVESAPTVVIDGRYVTSPSIAGKPGMTEPQSQAATLAVMDTLVAKVQKESGKGAAAPAKAVKK